MENQINQPPITSPLEKPKFNCWMVSTLLLFGILLFGILLQYRKTSLITQDNYEQTPSTALSENKNTTLEKSNIVDAELFIPFNGRSEKWTAYANLDYNFSFLFPASWRVDLSDDHLAIKQLTGCRGCGGGGFSGIQVSYYKNENNLTLDKFFPYTSFDKQTYVPFSKETYEYKVRNTNITVYIERLTPGAGPGQTAFIINNRGNDVVQLYCGDCNDSEMNNIVSTFDFKVERDTDASNVEGGTKNSWFNFL